MKKNYLKQLPDDIIEYIYLKIYYKNNEKIFDEIKLVYFIKNYVLLKYDIKNLCNIILIYSNYNINNININEINYIYHKTSNLSDEELYKLFNKKINKISLKEKYKLIFNFYDYRMHGINSITEKFIYKYINNIIKKFLNNE
tara:strand:+ start:447 stop:872 length:426 start_codon:yes stop_codon:yes gene_type:complete